MPRGAPARIALVTAAYLVATDQLRLGIVGGVTTLSVALPAISLLVALAGSVALATLVVGAAPYLRGPATRLAGAAAITGVTIFVVQPALASWERPLMPLARPEVFQEPYPVGVLAVSYALFVLTTLAVLAIVAATFPRARSGVAPPRVRTVGALLLLRGTLVAQLVFPWLVPGSVLLSALAISQFFLQDLLLTFCCWLLWQRQRR